MHALVFRPRSGACLPAAEFHPATRTGSVARLHHAIGYVWLPEIPNKPQHSRWISKNIALVEQIRSLSNQGATLRQIGLTVGLAHETVRSVLAKAAAA
jgi:hypothetical protein